MSRLIVMTGPCCAGKSEFVRQMKDRGELDGFDIVCPEDYYKAINGDAADRTNRERIWLAIWEHIMFNMSAGVNTLVDANAPTECSRTQYLEWFRGFDERELIYIDSSYITTYKNNQKRTERQLATLDLLKQWRDYDVPDHDARLYEWDSFSRWCNCGDGCFKFMGGR